GAPRQRPSGRASADLTAAAERDYVDGPAGRLEIAVADPGSIRRGVALLAHPHPLHGGTLDNKVIQTLAKAFFSLGFAALRFNFRGVGRSEGVFDNGRGEIEDVIAVAQYARTRFGGVDLALAGFSFGGYVAAQAARTLRPAKLVLVAPAVNLYALPPVQSATLVVHGEKDDVVPLKDLLAWARPQQLPVTVLPGAGHFFHGMLVPLRQLVQRYFGG
ncbi:MAG: alpha/beta hydrolase, partial [Burkholderiales bacterium]